MNATAEHLIETCPVCSNPCQPQDSDDKGRHAECIPGPYGLIDAETGARIREATREEYLAYWAWMYGAENGGGMVGGRRCCVQSECAS